MDEEIKEQVVEMLRKANEGMESSAGFLQAQMPEVVQQLLLWEALYSALFFLVGIAIAVGVGVPCAQAGKRAAAEEAAIRRGDKDGDYDAEETVKIVLGYVVPCFACLVGVTVMLINLDWIQIIVAPKYYLVEYIMGVV